MTFPVSKPVKDYLQEMLQRKPNTTQIDLTFRSIQSLLPYLHQLRQFPRLRKLELHGNRIRQLPTDLSMLSQLEELDLSNNILDDKKLDLNIMALKTLPKLRVLNYQVVEPKQARELKIVQEVTTLEYLNNTKVIREEAKKQYEFKRTNEKTLTAFQNDIMSNLRELLEFEKKYLGEAIQQDSENKFREELKTISQQCLVKLSSGQQNMTESLEIIMMYATKFSMYDLLKTRALDICMDIYSDLGRFIKNIFEEEDTLFKVVTEQALALARLQLDFNEQQEQKIKSSKFQQQFYLINKNSMMQKEIKRTRKQREESFAQISQMEALNNKYQEALVRLAKNDQSKANGVIDFHSEDKKGFSSNTHYQNTSLSGKQGTNPLAFKPITKPAPIRLSNQKPTSSLGAANQSLTLKQLKDIIEEIYEAKLRFDQKNHNGHLARETMSKYLFTHLQQKYGLKNLTVEAANNIVAALQIYSSQDNDVAVFGKILRNQIDQQFHFVQVQLKASMSEIIFQLVRANYPYKSVSQQQSIINEKINRQLTVQEAHYIVKYLFDKQESKQLVDQIQRVLVAAKQKDDHGQSIHRRKTKQEGPQEKRKIRYAVLVQVVLNFQLKSQEKKLRPLVNAFRMYDNDNDGVVDEDQFIAVIEKLSKQNSDLIPTLLDIVDPYETKSITFTQMARLVTNYPEGHPILAQLRQKEDEEGVSNQLDYQ